jgi:glutathione S-transferase
VNPEDAVFNKGDKVDADCFAVLRVKAAHLNLLENAVPFFVIGALYTATNPSKTGAMAYFGTFVGARVIHSFVYLAGKQPWRTIMFAIGLLATVGMAVHVFRAAL